MSDVAVAVGISRWKREAIRALLNEAGGPPLCFIDDVERAVETARREGGGIAVWPSRAPAGLEAAARDAGVPLARVEDGFIRSVGLGVGFVPPCSIVLDRRGIYYDPARASDLEHILQHGDFPPGLLARAEALAARIVAEGVGKYGRAPPPAAFPRGGRRTVLVAGQVEDDASVAAGGAGVTGNLDLLARARAAEPDAHVLFKPHPDVDAGHRRGRVADAALRTFADEVVREVPMSVLFARIDAVHVLTSLTGFEALLRKREVVVHGRPFYAGWGLTRDLAGPIPRRTRRLTLAELAAGTLILYPRYIDPETRRRCEPERLLDRFTTGWRPRTTWLIRARRLQGQVARLLGTTTD